MPSTKSCPAITATGKVPATVELGLLPDLWERIFQMLGFKSLLSVRSTCPRWKQIVDGSAPIMARMRVKFDGQEFDRDFQPASVVPAQSAKLSATRISCVGPWWTLLGGNLADLDLNSCKISTRMLLKLLQQTPNLKSLWYNCNYPVIGDISTDGILLNKLERLTVGFSSGEILDVFRKIFPRVKSLTVMNYYEPAKLYEYLEASSGIEELNLGSSDFVEYVLENKKTLQLNNVTSLSMFWNQPHEQTGDVFPELRCFSIKFYNLVDMVPTFLNKMNKLEKLSISSIHKCKDLDFSAVKPQPNLRDVNLCSVDLDYKSLYQFLRDVSPFCRLTLTSCDMISNLFATIEQMDKFEYLSLNLMTVDGIPSEYLDSLKCLKLSDLNVIELTKIRVDSKHIDDKVAQVLCEKLKLLETLTIEDCSVTDQTVEHIVNNCSKLRMLKIAGEHTLSDEGGRKLVRHITGLHPANCRVEIVKIPAQ